MEAVWFSEAVVGLASYRITNVYGQFNSAVNSSYNVALNESTISE